MFSTVPVSVGPIGHAHIHVVVCMFTGRRDRHVALPRENHDEQLLASGMPPTDFIAPCPRKLGEAMPFFQIF